MSTSIGMYYYLIYCTTKNQHKKYFNCQSFKIYTMHAFRMYLHWDFELLGRNALPFVNILYLPFGRIGIEKFSKAWTKLQWETMCAMPWAWPGASAPISFMEFLLQNALPGAAMQPRESVSLYPTVETDCTSAEPHCHGCIVKIMRSTWWHHSVACTGLWRNFVLRIEK